MGTASAFEFRKYLLDVTISVNETAEELERRLEKSWPRDLANEEEALQRSIRDAIAAGNAGRWSEASRQLYCCLRILIAHEKSVPQELMLWLVKRICVPLGFISQFRCRDLETAFQAFQFLNNFVWFGYNGALNGVQVRLKIRVEEMVSSVAYEYAMIHAQAPGLNRTIPALDRAWELLSSNECIADALPARCCNLLCTQYFRLGQVGNVEFWLSEWQRSIERMADSRKKEHERRECLIVEGCLRAEYWKDERTESLIRDLEKLREILLKEEGKDNSEVMEGDEKTQILQVLHVLTKLSEGCSGNARSPAENERRGKTYRTKMLVQSDLLEGQMKRLGLTVDNTIKDLRQKIRRAMNAARHEDAIRYQERLVEVVKTKPLYINSASTSASALAELRYEQAFCHCNLFKQKELKFFISKNCSSHPAGDSLKLCAHHCWSPHCQHDRHGCPEEKDEEDDEDEDVDEELAGLGRHELESPTVFYTKRHLESDGDNLHHLKTAVGLLNEALEHTHKAGSDVEYVVKVQSFLGFAYLQMAESMCRRLVGHESWPLPGELTPEVLDSKSLYTLEQVVKYLDETYQLQGTSPVTCFLLSHENFRLCAQRISEHLDSLKYYSDGWVNLIEKQKGVYAKLQNVMAMGLSFYSELCAVLSKLKNVSIEEVKLHDHGYVTFVANAEPEAFLWSERGRARFLELQLNTGLNQESTADHLEPIRTLESDLFHADDEVAWADIRSSLDACGEGTVFLEYSSNDDKAWRSYRKTLGRVYGVKKASGKSMEPLLMRDLPGDPVKLQDLLNYLHMAMNPQRDMPYDEEKVSKILEWLYELLITPDVAEFLKDMQHDHKLVICPSQMFTMVPFAALRNPGEKSRNKGYMFQNHSISISPSLRVLKYNEERYLNLQRMELMEGQGASLALGNPHYKNKHKWPPLDASGEEVRSIASLFPNRCKPLEFREATVENLVNRAKLVSDEGRSQAFVHIAAHCTTDAVTYKQGILKLADPVDCSTHNIMPESSSSSPPESGILSAEDVVKSKIDWRTRMVVLSACGSGKGEIKAEGVLNLPRAFMVAGVPCSVVSQWEVEDDSTSKLMHLFYQHMLKGVDVATALQSAMQDMLNTGSSIRQWAPFMVWGLPTVCLPDDLLSREAGVVLLQRGEKLMVSSRHADALLPLKKSLELLKALKTNQESDALVCQCLRLLADCEEAGHDLAQKKEIECRKFPIELKYFKYATKSHFYDLEANQFMHLTSAVQYVNEALEYAVSDDHPDVKEELRGRCESLTQKLETWKAGRHPWFQLPTDCGFDIVVEHALFFSHQIDFLRICVKSQVHLPQRIYKTGIDKERLQSAILAASHGEPGSCSFQQALEYLHEILIKPLLEDPMIDMTDHRTLVFIPCERLQGVPFALLRDGEGSASCLIRRHTISTVPTFEMLERCSQRLKEVQRLRLMPDVSDACLVLGNPAIPEEEAETGDSRPAFIVASQFPIWCKAVHGSESTVESLLLWASLPQSFPDHDQPCQAFFHLEAEIDHEIAGEVENCGLGDWRMHMAVVRATQSTNSQILKDSGLRLVKFLLAKGVPCVVMSNHLVDDVSSDVFFTHLYTRLRNNGDSVAAAARHAMLEMMDEGFELDQWGACSVFGDPTARLPREMLHQLRSNQT